MKKSIIFTVFLLVIFTIAIQAAPVFKLIYVIQEGDTLYDIAREYNLSVEKLKQANDISRETRIKVGEELLIPRAEKSNNKNRWDYNLLREAGEMEVSLKADGVYAVRVNDEQKLPEVNIPRDKIIKYHIGMGDTLYDLARSFNTSIGVIMALNEMEDSIIHRGDTLLLPINNLSPREVLARVVRPEEIELMARTIHGEARGEPFIGQVAVGAVIINRVLSSYFPDTFRDVIYQPGQFSAVADGQINLRPSERAYRAARRALAGTDPTMGSMYYYNPVTAKNKRWFATRRAMVTIGDHVFTK